MSYYFHINKVRAFMLAVSLVLSAGVASAQSHGNHLMLGIGASYPQGLEANLSYEHETDYHSAWEYFGSYYIKYDKDPDVGHITTQSFWHNYNTWLLGIAYKPCVSRGRNFHGNFRAGISAGSDLDRWVSGVHLGYEHTYNLYNGWSVFFQIKEDVVIRAKDNFRTGVVVGFKVPI